MPWLSLGLGLRKEDFARVLKMPKAFGVGLLNQLVLVPVVGFGLATAFGLPPELAVGLMILACSPGGVTTNVLTKIANANTPLSISMTAVTSLATIVTLPFIVAWSAGHFMGEAAPEITVSKLGLKMFLLTAVPVALGMALTVAAPEWVRKTGKGFNRAGVVLFVVVVLGALAKNWAVVSANFGTLGPALVLMNVVLLTLGVITARLLGLTRGDATTIAIQSGVQNGTLGIAVGGMIAASVG